MKTALRSLLEELESIQDAYDGIGDTSVREQMGDHVLRGFLRPESGFVPPGQYGLDPEANQKLAAALATFCTAAEAEARRLGIDTYPQRVAAFQDPTITTTRQSNFEDFFGVIEFDRARLNPTKSAQVEKGKDVQRFYLFDWPGPLDELHKALNSLGTWTWKLQGGGADDPFIDAASMTGVRVRIREGLETIEPDGTVVPPEHGFVSVLEAESTQFPNADSLFLAALDQVAASQITEDPDHWW